VSPLPTEQRKRISTAELLDALHLWLHREGGDRELAAACDAYDWPSDMAPRSHFPDDLTPGALRALIELRWWSRGLPTDVIGEAEDFHEALSDDECKAVDERVVALDGRVAIGRAAEYEVDNVIPLARKREVSEARGGK